MITARARAASLLTSCDTQEKENRFIILMDLGEYPGLGRAINIEDSVCGAAHMADVAKLPPVDSVHFR